MEYNNNFVYNNSISLGGATYNSAYIEVLVSLFETIKFLEPDIKIVALKLVTENVSLQDFMNWFVLQGQNDQFHLEDANKHFALFDLIDNQYAEDVLSGIIVSMFIMDNQTAIDEIKKVEAIVSAQDKFDYFDEYKIEALVNISDQYGLEEAKKIFAYISQFEPTRVTDKEPKKAVSDFIIGNIDGYDGAYDWIIPFDMKVNWQESSIQIMPQTESSYIQQPGMDGEIVEDTVYKNRLFSIVAFSELGLSVYEKEQLKRDITRVLDATKQDAKRLTFLSSDTSFDVKYSGSADIREGPSFVKATIPFESSPYGYPLFEREVYGTGLLVNDGDADVGCVHKISSGAVNPSFQLGSITYSWEGTVPDNTTLVIDHNNYTCYLETVEGTRTNAIMNLTGEFQVIPKSTSVAITAFGNTGNYITTTLQEKILWMGG